MARITKAEQALIPNVQLLMPETLVKSLDQDEVSDRVHYAKQLMAKSAAATDPTLKKSWARLAGAVLRTPKPRVEVERQVEDLRTKAKLHWNAVAAAGLRDEAERVLATNPIAPRRARAVRSQLAKAAAEGMMAVHDKDGNLIGVVAPEKVTRLVQAPQPAAGDGQTAAAGQRDMGTAKVPPAAETPAANQPADVDDVTKSARRLHGIVVRRPI